jgi:predicted choloylglycine hydrolase
VQVLCRVPVHMSYNVTVLDRANRWATVYVAPDRAARVTDLAAVTNHQGAVEWEPYASAIHSVERAEKLAELLADDTDVPGVVAACLRSPLYASRFHEGFGTLYTAEYRPAEGVARYHWPDRTWARSLHDVTAGRLEVRLGAARPAPAC